MSEFLENLASRLLESRTQKQAKVAEARERKEQAMLSPDEQAYQNARAELIASRQADELRIRNSGAGQDRLLHQYVEDFGRAIDKTVATVGAGIPLLAADLATRPGRDTNIYSRILRDRLIRPGFQKLGEFLEDTNDRDSVITRMDAEVLADLNAQDKAKNEAIYQERIDSGVYSPVAGAEYFGRELVDGLTNLGSRPTSLSNAIVGQLPLMGVGTVARVATPEASVAARAAANQAKAVAAAQAAGASGRAAGSELARQSLVAEAREALIKRNTQLAVTGMEVGGAYVNPSLEIHAASYEELKKLYPEAVAKYEAQNFSEERIRDELASGIGLASAGMNLPAAFIASRLGVGAQANPIGRTGYGALRETALDVGGEVLEETTQGASSQLSQNIAEIGFGNTETQVLDDAGQAAGQGAVTALGTSAILQGPRVAGELARPVVGGIYKAGEKALGIAGKAISRRADAVTAKQQEQTNQDTNQKREQFEGFEVSLRQAHPAISTSFDESTAMLDPAVEAMMKDQAVNLSDDPEAAPTSSLYSKIALLHSKDSKLSTEQRRSLLNSIQHSGRSLTELVNTFSSLSEEAQAQLPESIAEAIPFAQALLQDEDFTAAMALESDPDIAEADTKAVESAEAAGADATPEQLRDLQEVSYRAPEKLTEKAAEQLVLFQRKRIEETQDPEQKKQIELDLRYTEAVRDTGKILSQYAAEQKALDESIGVGNSGVTADMVTKRVRIEGFNNERSLKEYRADVLKALATGNKKEAASVMNQLQQFAVKFSQKARDFDTAVHDAYKTGNDDIIDKGITMPYRRLRNDGSLSQDSAWIIPRHSGLVDRIFVDARSTVNQFNRLVRALPELGLDELPLVGAPAFRAVKKRHDAKNPPKENSNAVAATTDLGGGTTPGAGSGVAQQAAQEAPAAEAPGTGEAPAQEVPAVDDTPPWDETDTRFVPQPKKAAAAPTTEERIHARYKKAAREKARDLGYRGIKEAYRILRDVGEEMFIAVNSSNEPIIYTNLKFIDLPFGGKGVVGKNVVAGNWAVLEVSTTFSVIIGDKGVTRAEVIKAANERVENAGEALFASAVQNATKVDQAVARQQLEAEPAAPVTDEESAAQADPLAPEVTESTTPKYDPDSPPRNVNDTRFVPQKGDPPTPPETSNSPSSDEAPFAVGKEADSNIPTSPEGEKLKQLIPKLQTEEAKEAAESFIAGTLTMVSGAVVKIPSTILARAVVLAERIAAGWASYPSDGSYAEQSDWFRNKSRDVPQPAELKDLLQETYQAAEAVDRFGAPTMLTAAEASGNVFTPAILTNWAKGRQVVNGVTDMENLCLATSRHVEWMLHAHGYKAAVAHGSVSVPGGKPGQMMDHYVAMAEIDGQIFIVDQPQGELFQPTGKGNEVKILRQEFAPRFIPLSDLDAAYGTVGVKFNLAANNSLTALPISDFAPSAVPAAPVTDEIAAAPAAIEERAAASGTLDDALAMSNEEYLAAINPGDKRTSEKEASGMLDELSDENQEDLEDAVSRADYVTERDGIVYKRNGNFIYAQDGDRVVGQLASISTGTTSAVLPEYQGRGIGTQLVKELLRTNPFAPAGSLSDGGARARTRALKELREEREALTATSPAADNVLTTAEPTIEEEPTASPEIEYTVDMRYYGIRQNAVSDETLENMSPAEKLAAKNRLATGFRYDQNGSGLFARIMDPIRAFADAVASDNPVDALLRMLPESQRNVSISEQQVDAIKTLATNLVPKRVKQLNIRLQDFVTRQPKDKDKKSILGSLMNNELVNWNYGGRIALMATRWGIGRTTNTPQMRYQNEIAQAMVLTGYQWASELLETPPGLSEKALDKMFPTGVPEHLEQAFRTRHLGRDAAEDLGKKIFKVLGLKAKRDLPQPYDTALPYALGLEVLSLLQAEGVIQISHENIALDDPENKTSIAFIEVPKDGEIDLVTKALGGSDFLGRFLDSSESVFASVGNELTDDARPFVQGTNQPLSKEHLKAQERARKQKHTLNFEWMDDVGSIGLLNIRRLRGWKDLSDVPEDSMNQQDRRAQMSVNSSIERAYATAINLYNSMLAFGEKNGIPLKDVPAFHSWRAVSSMRSMVNQSNNSQGNKDVRELLSPHASTVDLTNQESLDLFRLTLAQALGEKTEAQAHQVSIDAAMSKLDGVYEPAVSLWMQMHAAEGDDAKSALGQQVFEALQAIKPEYSARELNALSHYARYRALRENNSDGLKEFRSQMALEADGKTDGMFNALFHFGLDSISGYMINQFRQGGLMIGQTFGTLNESITRLKDAKENMDLYTNVTTRLQEILRARGSDGSRDNSFLAASTFLLTSVGEMGFDPKQIRNLMGTLEVKRNLGKEPMTQTVYGAVMYSVMRNKARQLTKQVYREMSEALANGTQISEVTARAVEKLLSRGFDGQDSYPIEARSIAKSDYVKFRFTKQELDTITRNLMEEVGQPLDLVLEQEMNPAFSAFKSMYLITNLQGIRYKKAFTEAHMKKRQELIDAGEMLLTEDLSRAQLDEIREELKHLAVTMRSQIGTNIDLSHSEDGQNLVVQTRNKDKEIVPTEYKVRALTGGSLEMPVPTREIALPGVRAAALTTQGAGDASMMLRFAQLLGADVEGMGGTLDVFDGLEMTFANALNQGKLINQASWEALQYDIFGEFETMLSNLADFQIEDGDVDLLVEGLKPRDADGKLLKGADALEEIRLRFEEAKQLIPLKAARIRATKRALAEEKISHDHMATTATPHQLNGGVADAFESNEAIAARIRARTKELMAEELRMPPATEDVDMHKGLNTVLGNPDGTNARTMSKAQLGELAKTVPFKTPVHKFLFNHLFPMLPSTMAIHWGKPSALQLRKEELFGADAARMGDGTEPGMMVGDQVFMSVASQETLVHELVHVVAQDLLHKFYVLGGKGLTDAQRAAALQIDKLTQAFLKLKVPVNAHILERSSVEMAQNEVRFHVENGNTAAAVNEFLSWSLTNPEVARRLQKTRTPKGVMKLVADARDWFRKLLGLPNNSEMASFFESTLGNFVALTSQDGMVSVLSDTALFQRVAVGDEGSEHNLHLRSVYQRFQRMLATLPVRQGLTLSAEQKLLDIQAEVAREHLKDNGLHLTTAQELTFDSIHAVLSSNLPLDPVVLHGMSETYGQAMKQLKMEMLLKDPANATPIERVHAQQILDVLAGKNVGKDANNRSLVLANFFAAAQTHEPLRKALMSLAPPKAEKVKGNLDSKVRRYTSMVFDWLSNRAIGVAGAHTQDAAINALIARLEKAHGVAQRAEAARKAPNQVTAAIDKAESRIQEVGGNLADKANAKLQARQATGNTTRAESIVAQLVDASLNAMRTDGEGLIQGVMAMPVPLALMELMSDAIGSTQSTESLYALLNKVKYVVATTRQRLREEVPQQVRELFSEPLTKEDGLLLMDTMARIDQQVFVGTYSVNQIVQMMNDDVSLGSVIQSEIQNLSVYAAEYEAEARSLAKALVHREYASRYRNATAMAELLDYKKVSMADAEHNRPILDRLVTLMAIQELSQSQREATARLMERDVAGTEKLLLSLRHLAAVERNKNGSGVANYNGWKGYIPESRDPRSNVVLATPVQAKDLVKRGYRRVAAYKGDPRDPGSVGMAYYAIDHAGGPSTYVQGVLQTVAPTAQGLNLESGATISPHAARMIQVVGGSFGMTKKLKASNFKDSLLSPVYDTDGEIIAYERVLDPVLLENHLKGDQDIAQSIGIWAGRQMEERLAVGMNSKAVKKLKKMYDNDLQSRDQYIDLATAKDPVYADAWKALPVSVQKQMLGAFNGKALVREDMIRNVVGYRSPSIGDIFTGLSRLPAPVQKQAHDVALAIFGQDAYRKLVAAERAWEGAVGTAKDIIIVRMGVVALGNILSNVIQLTAHGVPVLQIPRLLARKAQETEIHMRNEKRLAQLMLQIRTARTKAEESKYKQEAERLKQENQRLSIAPLILAGELPTIAEGLTEQDQYNSFNDGLKLVEKKIGALPASMVTAAKYAVIARDTAVYQGLNRFIQFGDFTAKAVIYDQLIAQGMPKDQALARTSERFVNYNRNAGRTRDKLEQLGLIWFWNYKVRIQKIVLSTLRDNPLRFLMSSLGADLLGQDSLATSSALGTNWGYSIGPGQMERALDGGLWFQMVD